MPVINKNKKEYGPSLFYDLLVKTIYSYKLKEAFEKMMAERIPVLRGVSKSLVFFDDNGNDDSIPWSKK